MTTSYYKVQFYCETSMSWKDIQKKFTELGVALTHIRAAKVKENKNYRLMEVAGKKRSVVAGLVV